MMAGLLRKEGYAIAASPEQADCVVLNMCSVKLKTERKMVRRAGELHMQKPLVVAGCIPPGQTFRRIPGISLVNTQNLHHIGRAVSAAVDGHAVAYISREERPKLGLPRIRRNPAVSIVPISTGCDLACAFCVTTIIKGKLQSYPMRAICDEVSRGLQEGCREFWLTSQDNGAYLTGTGRSMLPELIRSVAALDGEFRVRVGMTNPVHVKGVLDSLLDAYEHANVYKFLHLPLQSGSDRILAEMGRGYTAREFLAIAAAFRARFPESTLSTDVICGYPGESEEDFRETMAALEELRPEMLHLSRYSPRDGTRAALQEQVHWGIVKERTRAGFRTFLGISAGRCAEWKGWSGRVLVSEEGKPGTMVAHNDAYRQIVIPGDASLLGRFVNVRVTGVGRHYLRGELC